MIKNRMQNELTEHTSVRMTVYPIVVLLVSIALTACTAVSGLDTALVKQAIALQLNQVQVELAQQLYRHEATPPTLAISQVKIAHQTSWVINDQPAYQVKGTYDVTLTFSDHQVRQRQNPFEVYLQPVPDEPLWQLARPPGNGKEGDRWMLTTIR